MQPAYELGHVWQPYQAPGHCWALWPRRAPGLPGLMAARIYPYLAALLCFFLQLALLRVSDVCVIIGSHSFRPWPEGCEYEAMLSVWLDKV